MAIDYRPTLSPEKRNELIRHGYTKYYSELRDKTTNQLLYPNATDVAAQVEKTIGTAIAKPWSGYTDWRKILLAMVLHRTTSSASRVVVRRRSSTPRCPTLTRRVSHWPLTSTV